jgi:protein-S-isoprenylcysteine O-methyltransferase Ste14
MTLDAVEQTIRTLGAVAGLATLTIAVTAMLLSVRRPAAREEAGARRALRPANLLVGTIAFVAIGVLLWHRIPVDLRSWARVALLLTGAPLFFGGLALYLLGMRSLGNMFAPSTGFGVRLQAVHRLVTTGAYARIRHPMYLSVIATALGTFFLYRTWASLLFAVGMFGLVIRARREERVLAEEFPVEWAAYTSRVPAWWPRLRTSTRLSKPR